MKTRNASNQVLHPCKAMKGMQAFTHFLPCAYAFLTCLILSQPMCIEWTQSHVTSSTSIGSHALDALAEGYIVFRIETTAHIYCLIDQVIPQGIESRKARKSFTEPSNGAVYITKFMTIIYYNGTSNQILKLLSIPYSTVSKRGLN